MILRVTDGVKNPGDAVTLTNFSKAQYAHVLLLKCAAGCASDAVPAVQEEDAGELGIRCQQTLNTSLRRSVCQAENRQEALQKNQLVKRCHTQPYGDLKIYFDMIIPHSFHHSDC